MGWLLLSPGLPLRSLVSRLSLSLSSLSLSRSLGASWALWVARRGRVRLFVACNAMYVVIEVIMGKAANDPWLESTARQQRGRLTTTLVSTLIFVTVFVCAAERMAWAKLAITDTFSFTRSLLHTFALGKLS